MMVSYMIGFSSTRDATSAKHSAVHKCSGVGGVRISKRLGLIPTKSCDIASKQTYFACDGKCDARSISAANFHVASKNINVNCFCCCCCLRSNRASVNDFACGCGNMSHTSRSGASKEDKGMDGITASSCSFVLLRQSCE